MKGRGAAATAAVLFLLVMVSASAARAETPRPVTAPALVAALRPGSAGTVSKPGKAAGVEASIEWKETLDGTWEATVERWRQELKASAGADPPRFTAEFARRLMALAHALLDRPADGGNIPPGLYRTMAAEFGALGGEASGRVYLRRLVEAFPGHVGLAIEALDAIQSRVSADGLYESVSRSRETAGRVRESPDLQDWVEYASGRLIALNRAGYLPDTHPAIERAWKTRLSLRLAERRFWEAALALDALRAITGETAWWQTQWADLYAAAGRHEDALRLYYEVLAGGKVSDSSIYSRLKLLAKMPDAVPDFPRDLGLEMRWTALRSRAGGTDTATIQVLLDESAEGQGLMAHEDGLRASVWVLLDRLLALQKPETLSPLRQSQARGAEEPLERLCGSDDPQAMVALGRRFPWSAAVQAALLESGERWLRRGQAGLALRTFQDVLTHAEDADLRGKAQVGVWLSILSATRDRAAVEAAFAGVAPNVMYPWMDGKQAASAIRQRLLEGLDEPAPSPGAPAAPSSVSPAAGPAMRLVRTPAVAPWDPAVFYRTSAEVVRAFPSPLGSVGAAGGAAAGGPGGRYVLVAGPNLLACYGEDLSRPLWWRTPQAIDKPLRRGREPDSRGGRVTLTPAPGPFEPALAEGRVVSRWGADPTGQYLRGVEAFDAATGRILWSTDEDPAWAAMLPVGDPALVDGRVYVLAVQEKVGPMMPVNLVCLDGDRGTVLWNRPLGSQNFSIKPESYRYERPMEPVHYGNAVAVHGGAVYAVSNLGFVARCDARDGMVEWLREYGRVSSGAGASSVFRRQGAAPMIAGGRVLCMPRDYQGVFALEAATGRPAWESPLVPAEEAVGVAGGLWIVKGDGHVLALEAATGRVRWDRTFAEGITARPALAGSAIYVATPTRLWRIDAQTGTTLEEKPWDVTGPLRAMAVRDGAVVGVSDASPGVAAPEVGVVGPAAGPHGPSGAKGAAKSAARKGGGTAAGALAPLAMPLREAWRLDRPGPDLWLPPAEAKLPDRLMVISRGLLECVETGPQARSVWQRFMAPGFEEALWAEKTILLAHERQLVCLDGETGVPRWQCDVPFPAGLRQVCPPYVVVAQRSPDPPQEQQLAVIELATGQVRWVRPMARGLPLFRLVHVALAGQNLRCYGDGWEGGKTRGFEITLRAADGELVGTKPFPAADEGRILGMVTAPAAGFCVTGSGALWEFSPASTKAARRWADVADLNPRASVTLKLTGPWLQVLEGDARAGWSNKQWIFRRDDPSYVLRQDRSGGIRGDRLYVPAARGVTAVDLKTRQEVTYEVPGGDDAASLKDVLDFYVTTDRLWLASSLVTGWQGGTGGLRFDLFDLASGAPLQMQTLGRILPQGGRPRGVFDRLRERDREAEREEWARTLTVSQLVWTKDAVYLTDSRGLYAVTSGGDEEAGPALTQFVSKAPQPVTVDGLLGEWDEADAVPLAGPGPPLPAGAPPSGGRLYLLHDAQGLYLAVRYATPAFQPRVGSIDTGGGDRLEIGVSAGLSTYRWAVGADARGRVVWEALSDGGLPEGLQAAVRYDAAARELVYEAAIPAAALVPSSSSSSSSAPSDPRRMGLSVAVWDDPPGGAGPARVLVWGGGLAGRRLLATANQPIYLYPMDRRAAQAMQAVVDQLPDVPEAFEYFRRSAALRADSGRELLDLYGDFLKGHPKSITVQRLLGMDQAIRERDGSDPSPALADLAAKAGVPDAVRKRYALESQAYLSQWVYVPLGMPPRGIVLEVSDGIAPGPAGWDHRVVWNKPPLSQTRPAYEAPERLPQGEWYEIKMPLALLNLNGLPLCGISFGQQGEAPVVWDRSAIVFGGKEEVFLEDEIPAGAFASGVWQWVDEPVKSGARAHRGEEPSARYNYQFHWVSGFPTPVTLHVDPSPPGPYVSQWVWLDPQNPPTALSLGLHDGHGWRLHALWGRKTRHGLYAGPLPAAGQWQELRLPLAGTPLASEPIGGVGFGHEGGRVVWDRTALVIGGRDQVLIDDALPLTTASPSAAWLPWAEGYAGRTYPVPGKVGAALACDGQTGFMQLPHSEALEPAEMTLEAWLYVKSTAWSADSRRWLVSKNANESVDGHYALVINKDAVGAYLNIGGGETNRFEAWSDPKALAASHWHHAAMTYDGKDLKVYVDGQPAGATAVNRPRTPGNTPFQIGRRQDGYTYYGGYVDEVRLYKRALSAGEVAARFAAGGEPPADAATAAAVVAHWGFDEDAMPADPLAAWQWVQQPVKSGKRAHTDAGTGACGGHVCLFKEPVITHLPFDPKRALAVLREQVPRLGPTDEAWRLLGRMLKLDPTLQGQADLYGWFLKAIPGHPQALEALRAFQETLKDLRPADAAAEVEAAIRDAGLPDEVVFSFRRRYTSAPRGYLQAWQIIGSFAGPNGHAHNAVFPPETEPFRAGAVYDGAKGKVQWKPVQVEGGDVDLLRLGLVEPTDLAVAYAVCWVHSDQAQPAVLEMAVDDTGKVWLNRELVLNSVSRTGYKWYSVKAAVQLPAGWSEVLVKTTNVERNWRFCLELLDPTGLGMPKGVTVSGDPSAHAAGAPPPPAPAP